VSRYDLRFCCAKGRSGTLLPDWDWGLHIHKNVDKFKFKRFYMALTKCPECGKSDVSDKAEQCPNCGFPLKKTNDSKSQEKPNKDKRLSDGQLGCLVFFGILILIWAISSLFNDSPAEKVTPQQSQKSKVESQFSAWDGSHIGLTKYVKSKMNDPDSYEHVETRFEDKGSHILVATKFRGNNKFGGKVLNTILAKVDYNGNVLEIISQE
jgi:ribosomal protein L37E